MSTMYVPLEKIRFCHLFDGRLEAFNVREFIPTEEEIGGDEDWRPTERQRVLTDGSYFMWAYADKDGFVDRIVRYGANAPASILNAITEVFSIAIVSERQPQFWGYDTQEEWDAANAGIAEQHEEEFYLDLLRYLRGEPHSIGPGTVGMVKAQIAHKLVGENPDLMLPAQRRQLMSAIEAIYSKDHEISITLSDAEMSDWEIETALEAAVRLALTRKDNLPQA